MKRLLITGSSGFIGKNLIEQLSTEYTVLSPSHGELDLTDGDAVDAWFEKNSVDAVIHAAYIGGNRKTPLVEEGLGKNLSMFLNLVKNSNRFRKMIFLGSGAEYDKSKPIVQAKEEDFGKQVPKDQYGLSKYLCSEMIKWSKNIISLRLFGVYGKYEDAQTRFISNAINQSISSGNIQVNQNVRFDYLCINDLVKIVSYFIENEGKEKIYNVGSGQPIELTEIAEKIKNITHASGVEVLKDGLGNEYTCDISKLKSEIGDFQFTPLEKGIDELYQWYRSN